MMYPTSSMFLRLAPFMGGKQDGYQQQTHSHAAMRQYQSEHRSECQRERTVLRNDLLSPFKDQSGAWRNGTSFGLNDLEALVTVAHEAKEWIAAHVLKR